MALLAWGGRRQDRRRICERLVLRGGTHELVLVSSWALSHVLCDVVCVCRYVDTIQEATLNGNKPHIRHGGLSRESLMLILIFLHMGNKVGYKRRDMYGTLLATTPHHKLIIFPKLLQTSIHCACMDDDLLPAAHPICPRGPERCVTAGKHVRLAVCESARRPLEGR